MRNATRLQHRALRFCFFYDRASIQQPMKLNYYNFG